MTAIISPLSTGTINGEPVRFYKAPGAEPELPWHAHDDLLRALKLSREKRRYLLRSCQAQCPGEMKTIATVDGLVTIAPHPLAQALLGAVAEVDAAFVSVEIEYRFAGVAAMKALGAGLPPAARFELAITAARNTLSIERTSP